jgi:hypothetical protein
MSDRLQGYNLTVDASSGHGSLSSTIIENILRDETPKAPITLYSVKDD